MNSLEALKELKETAISTLKSLYYPTSYLVEDELEDIEEQANKIEKDLEILEILKKDCRLDGMLYYGNFAFVSELNKEECQKIMEWLEEK